MYILTQKYGDNPAPTELFIQSEFTRFRWLAEQLGIELCLQILPDGFQFKFETINDQALFQRNAFNPQNKEGSHIHTMKFEGNLLPSDFMNAWACAVKELANQNGVECSVSVEGYKVITETNSIEDNAIHVNACGNGRYTKRAYEILDGPKQ